MRAGGESGPKRATKGLSGRSTLRQSCSVFKRNMVPALCEMRETFLMPRCRRRYGTSSTQTEIRCSRGTLVERPMPGLRGKCCSQSHSNKEVGPRGATGRRKEQERAESASLPVYNQDANAQLLSYGVQTKAEKTRGKHSGDKQHRRMVCDSSSARGFRQLPDIRIADVQGLVRCSRGKRQFSMHAIIVDELKGRMAGRPSWRRHFFLKCGRVGWVGKVVVKHRAKSWCLLTSGLDLFMSLMPDAAE